MIAKEGRTRITERQGCLLMKQRQKEMEIELHMAKGKAKNDCRLQSLDRREVRKLD